MPPSRSKTKPRAKMTSTWSLEVETQVAPSRLYKAAFVDWHNIGPKLLPELIASIALLTGDGGQGSVYQANFTSALSFGHVKERLEFVDHDRFEIKAVLLEGAELGNKFEAATSHFRIEPKGDGSLMKFEGTYTPLPGVDVSEVIKKAEEIIVGKTKAVEGYLLANPTAYA